MAEITKRVELSAKMFKNLKTTPTDDEMLKLYGLYKQTEGDCNAEKPSMLNFKEKAKWVAWTSYKGMKSEDAMTKYSDHVMSLINKYSTN
jgi:diazepam-binding inhibitor (GABA receptor modulating acyl-CoA-binding protein)